MQSRLVGDQAGLLKGDINIIPYIDKSATLAAVALFASPSYSRVCRLPLGLPRRVLSEGPLTSSHQLPKSAYPVRYAEGTGNAKPYRPTYYTLSDKAEQLLLVLGWMIVYIIMTNLTNTNSIFIGTAM